MHRNEMQRGYPWRKKSLQVLNTRCMLKLKGEKNFESQKVGVAHIVGLTMLARWKRSDSCAIWSRSRSRGRTGYRVVGIGVVAGGFVDALTSAERTRVSPSG